MVMDRELAIRPQRGRYPCREVVVVAWRLEVEEDSLEIVDSFCYLGDLISCGGEAESAVRDRISCAWNKWRELVSYIAFH